MVKQKSLLQDLCKPSEPVYQRHLQYTYCTTHANRLHVYIHTNIDYVKQSMFVNTTTCTHFIDGVMLTMQHSSCFAQDVLISSPARRQTGHDTSASTKH